VIKKLEYDAFGTVVGDSDAGFLVPFGFAGGLHDRDTGLVRFGYRDYDPEVGRWTAKDPIGFAGGDTDLYGYVLNDPVNWVDTSGFFRAPPFGDPIGYNTDYGGPGSWTQPKGGGIHDWNSKLTPGQKMATLKLVGGAVAVAGGALQGDPKMIYGGIVVASDGLVQAIAEALGGDTSKIPLPAEMLHEIGKGMVEGIQNNQSSNCESMSDAGYDYWY
jgi:RHS repeat-associated protein